MNPESDQGGNVLHSLVVALLPRRASFAARSLGRFGLLIGVEAPYVYDKIDERVGMSAAG